MLLRSEITSTLLESGAKLVICSPNGNEEYFRKEFEHPQIQIELMPTQTNKWEDRLMTWRQFVLMNPSLGGTLNYKRETLKRTRPKRYYATRAVNLFLGNVPILRRTYMAMESRLFPAREFDALFEKHKPDLVVTGTPGFNTHDVHALRSSKRLNIPTATVMLSWDNLTSKGYMNGVPDHLLVWSQLMAEEAVEYHDFPEKRIHLTGAAQFDIYHQARQKTDISQWRADNGIPADAFMMMYGTINPAICNHETKILATIIEAMRNQTFTKKPHLWIRLHPQVVKGPWQESLQPFLDLKADDVTVEVPPVRESQLNWDLPKSDATHLMNLLASSDLCITTSSTLSIDSVCAGTPIANVFFDGCDVKPEMSVARFKNYTHYAKILATGGIRVANNVQEFSDLVSRYMTEPLADQVNRKKIIEQQIWKLDGQSGRRTAEGLLKLAGNSANYRKTES